MGPTRSSASDAHAYHDSLPGYDPHQLLVDGCGTCEARGRDIRIALDYLDAERFARAWFRAAIFNRMETEDQLVGQISDAERPLLDVLWAIIVQLERRGLPIPSMPPAGGLRDLSQPHLEHLTPDQLTVLKLAVRGLDAIVDRDGWLKILDLAWGHEATASEALSLQQAFIDLRTALGGS